MAGDGACGVRLHGWIGEILGGPPVEDPQLPYVKTTVCDTDIYKFTLTKSRTAQFDGIPTGMT